MWVWYEKLERKEPAERAGSSRGEPRKVKVRCSDRCARARQVRQDDRTLPVHPATSTRVWGWIVSILPCGFRGPSWQRWGRALQVEQMVRVGGARR